MTVRKLLVAVGFSVALILTAITSGAQESEDKSLAAAVTAGEAHVGIRYRFENVDQDGFSDDANASTVRLRLNYKTGSWQSWSGFVEFDYIGELLFKDFNSLGGSSPERDRYPVVADPKGPDLNQLYLDYAPAGDTKVRLGRERIVLDNHRFVGDVGWRQNIQTYDGAGFSFSGWQDTEVFYRYVTTVRTILGDNVPAGRRDTDTHLLNVRVKLSDDWTVIPYLYLIDDNDAAAFSTTTFGARLTGDVTIGDTKVNLVAEAATQSDAANNPVNYDAKYLHAAANWSLSKSLTLGVAFESLGGDQNIAGASFRTPLATLHAFQGWADKFLATPGAGIDDFFVTAKYKFGVWNFTGVYHDFSAESGSADWGTELDLSVGRSFGDHYGLLFKAALYDADQHATDTTKLWIMFTGNY
jgi:hypothetical protein